MVLFLIAIKCASKSLGRVYIEFQLDSLDTAQVPWVSLQKKTQISLVFVCIANSLNIGE